MRLPRWGDLPWAFKLATLLVTTAIVPLSILTVFGEAMSRRHMVAEAGARNLQRARNTAALLDSHLSGVAADLAVVALAPPTVSVLTGPDEASRRVELRALLENVRDTKRLEVLTVLDDTGTIVSATDATLIGQSRVSAPYFMSAMAGQTRAHDPTYHRGDGRVYMHVSVPVLDVRERIAGVVAARVSLDTLDRLIAGDTDFGGLDEYGLLWDDRGVVISSPAVPLRRFRPLGRLLGPTRDRLVAEQRFGPETERLLSVDGSGDTLVDLSRWQMYDDRGDAVTRLDLGDGPVLVSSAPIRDRRWTYGLAVPEASVLAEVREESRRNLTVALATALLALGLALASARWLSRPLKQVGDAARGLAAGDLTRRVRLARRDEIGEMADAFDSMADAIARKDAELRRHADTLERRVAERTGELRGLLDAVPDLMFKVGQDGRLLDYVAAKADDLVLAPEEFLGRRLPEVLPPDITHPAMATIARVLAGETAEPFEYRLTVQSEVRNYEARASASGPDTVVFLVRDITERRRNEEKTRFLASAGAILASSLDYGNTVETLARLPVPGIADLCIVDLLEHGTQVCGAVAARSPELEARAQMARRTQAARTPGPGPTAVAVEPAGRTGVEGDPPRSPEQEAILAAVAPCAVLTLPLVARGQALGAMSFVTVTEGRRVSADDLELAQELVRRAAIALDNARLYRDLQESSRLKDEFLGTVSHELRTPLNAVLGWAQVMRRTSGDPEQTARALEAIERNARAQAQLVEDLLDTSRAISGKLRIELATLGVAAVVHQAIESFRPAARARGIELAASVARDVGEIRADAARLQQVIGNLLSNGLKFTPAGGRIAVTATRTGRDVRIRVADTGAGIPAEFLPYVFDRFRQADSTTTRAHGGLGIGLAIARHLVELHGGTIHAESDGENRGAAFTVVLPVVAGVEPAHAREASAPVPVPHLAGVEVLVVDDQAEGIELLQAVLGGTGARVETARSADEALARLHGSGPDLLVADIAMPEVDGYTLIREIRRLEEEGTRPKLPAIALTACARDEDRRRALAAGFDRHLAKPFDAAALLQIVGEMLGDRRGTAAPAEVPAQPLTSS